MEEVLRQVAVQGPGEVEAHRDEKMHGDHRLRHQGTYLRIENKPVQKEDCRLAALTPEVVKDPTNILPIPYQDGRDKSIYIKTCYPSMQIEVRNSKARFHTLRVSA